MTAPLVCVGPDAPRIIPLPRDWRILEGAFELPQQVTIGYRGDGAEDVARYLSGMSILSFEGKVCLHEDLMLIHKHLSHLDLVIRTPVHEFCVASGALQPL